MELEQVHASFAGDSESLVSWSPRTSMKASSARIVATVWPVVVSHSRTVWSLLAVVSQVPSGEIATDRTQWVWPVRVVLWVPVGVPFKKPKDATLTADQQTFNTVHSALRCLGERADSLLKTTYKALRRQRGCPWRIGKIVAAALVLLYFENDRTT